MGGTNGSGLRAISILPRRPTLLEAICWRSFQPTAASEPFTPKGPNFDNRLPQTLADGTVRNTPITDAYNYTPRGFIIGPGKLEHRHLGL